MFEDMPRWRVTIIDSYQFPIIQLLIFKSSYYCKNRLCKANVESRSGALSLAEVIRGEVISM